MKLNITKSKVLMTVALAAIGVMSAATLAWAAPTITSGTTPPATHVADGRSVQACTGCHTVTVPAPVTDPTPVTTTTPDPTVTPTPDSTVTPTPDTTGTLVPCIKHGMTQGHHLYNDTNDQSHKVKKVHAKRHHNKHSGHDAVLDARHSVRSMGQHFGWDDRAQTR